MGEQAVTVNKQYLYRVLNHGKGEVLKELEKICPTEKSFQRMIKDMHDIFDEMMHKLAE